MADRQCVNLLIQLVKHHDSLTENMLSLIIDHVADITDSTIDLLVEGISHLTEVINPCLHYCHSVIQGSINFHCNQLSVTVHFPSHVNVNTY